MSPYSTTFFKREKCRHLLENCITNCDTIKEYIQCTDMERDRVWGTTTELLVFSHISGVNVDSYNSENGSYHVLSPGVIDPNHFPEDNSQPTINIVFTGGNHFNIILSQD